MTRLFDLCFAFFGLLLLSPVFLALCVLGWLDTSSPLFLQTRVGRPKKSFVLVKFGAMQPNIATIATRLASPRSHPLGRACAALTG